eukprot:scaffold7585_cov72-Cylindrotheca_fusiformis.AAC.2
MSREKTTLSQTREYLAISQDELPHNVYPLRMSLISTEQAKDVTIQTKLKDTTSGFISKQVRGGSKCYDIVFQNDKIVVPLSLRQRLIKWYHEVLMHPGLNRTEQTIRMHFTWPKLRSDVEKICKHCRTCQLAKKTRIKYGYLPPKEAEATPWNTLCIDLIGPYTVK